MLLKVIIILNNDLEVPCIAIKRTGYHTVHYSASS